MQTKTKFIAGLSLLLLTLPGLRAQYAGRQQMTVAVTKTKLSSKLDGFGNKLSSPKGGVSGSKPLGI